MTYQQTIEYLYQQLPMFSHIGAAAYKKDLHNTIALCQVLDNPHTKFKTIHIAGTNGKGSVSHMLAAILQQAGYKTGLYTSPHLTDFRERIKINGQMLPQDFVVDFVQRTRAANEAIQPSFFEVTVAMAYDYFASQQVDIAVIETGLGGRLDSTNIITPLLSVITNIGYDHMNILGDSLDKIAAEKAGIIKPGVPVVVGEYLNETKHVFIKKAAACHADLFFAQDACLISNTVLNTYHLSCDVTTLPGNQTHSYTLDLNGLYQIKNLRTVLKAAELLQQLGLQLSNEVIHHALAHTKKLTGLHGRWEVIADEPTIVLDVAHNEDGMKQVIQQLALVRGQYNNLHIVVGMVKDKDVSKVLSLLPKDALYYFTNAHIPRALPAKELQQKALLQHLKGNTYDDVNTAIAAAMQHNDVNDLVLVCGSVFLVGEVNRAQPTA
jgi:dihydrofolate synthase / folylpolyglutamate synthase